MTGRNFIRFANIFIRQSTWPDGFLSVFRPLFKEWRHYLYFDFIKAVFMQYMNLYINILLKDYICHIFGFKVDLILGFPFFRKKIPTRNLEQPGKTPRNPISNSEPGKISGFGLERKMSGFWVGTRKNVWVPTRNSKIPSSGFRKFLGYFRVFPHYFPKRKNSHLSGFFRVGTRNPEFRWKPYLIPFIKVKVKYTGEDGLKGYNVIARVYSYLQWLYPILVPSRQKLKRNRAVNICAPVFIILLQA